MPDINLKFKKKHLWYLNQWFNVNVIKSQNRFRNEFLSLIFPTIEALESGRLEIIKAHASKDAKGKVEVDHMGNYIFASADDRKGADDDFNKLLEEDVEVVIAKPKVYDFAKDYIKKFEPLNPDGKPQGFGFVEGKAYDEICDIMGVE